MRARDIKLEVTELTFDIRELPNYRLETIVELVSSIQEEYPDTFFIYLSPDNYKKLRRISRSLPILRIEKGTGKRNIVIAQRVAE